MCYAHADDRYEPVDLPLGRQTLPTWARDFSVHWMRGYAQAPCTTIRVPERDRSRGSYPAGLWHGLWPLHAPYVEERPGYYVARHQDGRVHQLHHQPMSELRWAEVEVAPAHCWYSDVAPGRVWHGSEGYRDLRSELGYAVQCRPLFPRRRVLQSLRSEGFGGSSSDIEVLVEGQLVPVRLRGPWHVAPPEGCVETAGSDRGSLTLTEDLFLRVVATHAPHLRVFRVWLGGRRSSGQPGALQVAHGSWGCPKGWLPREHQMFAPPAEVNEWSRRG